MSYALCFISVDSGCLAAFVLKMPAKFIAASLGFHKNDNFVNSVVHTSENLDQPVSLVGILYVLYILDNRGVQGHVF